MDWSDFFILILQIFIGTIVVSFGATVGLVVLRAGWRSK
jgi:hypothetical protein